MQTLNLDTAQVSVACSSRFLIKVSNLWRTAHCSTLPFFKSSGVKKRRRLTVIEIPSPSWSSLTRTTFLIGPTPWVFFSISASCHQRWINTIGRRMQQEDGWAFCRWKTYMTDRRRNRSLGIVAASTCSNDGLVAMEVDLCFQLVPQLVVGGAFHVTAK